MTTKFARHLPYLGPLLVLITACGLHPQPNYDVWFHLQLGKESLESLRVPQADYHSFTRHGAPYQNHEWLSAAIFYVLYRMGGEGWTSVVWGLLALKFLLAGLTVALVYRMALRGSHSSLAASLLAVVCAVGLTDWIPLRPQLFTFCFLSLALTLLEDFRLSFQTSQQTGRQINQQTGGQLGSLPRWTAWLLVPLFVVWANLHGGFLGGAGLIVVYLALGWAQHWLGSAPEGAPQGAPQGALEEGADFWSKPALRHLTVIALLSFAATLLNPYGAGAWSNAFHVARASDASQGIQEWGSPDFHSFHSWGFLAMLVLGFILTCAGRVPPLWSHVALLVLTLVMALHSMRHMPLFLLCAPLCLGRYARPVAAAWRRRTVEYLSRRQQETLRSLLWVRRLLYAMLRERPQKIATPCVRIIHVAEWRILLNVFDG